FSNQRNLEDQPTPIDTTIDMTIPFVFGTPTDFAVFACSVAGLVTPFSELQDAYLDGQVSVDFSHTGVIQRASVLDAEGHEVLGATISSASGFDYLHPGGAGDTTTTTATSTTEASTSTTIATTTTTITTTPITTTSSTIPTVDLRFVAGKSLALMDG